MLILAQTKGASSTTLLDRLDAGQLFGLTCTMIVISAAVIVIVSLLAFSTLRSIRLTHARTRFVQSMLEQGLNADEITQLSTVAFGSSFCSRKIARSASSESTTVPPAKQFPKASPPAKPAMSS